MVTLVDLDHICMMVVKTFENIFIIIMKRVVKLNAISQKILSDIIGEGLESDSMTITKALLNYQAMLDRKDTAVVDCKRVGNNFVVTGNSVMEGVHKFVQRGKGKKSTPEVDTSPKPVVEFNQDMFDDEDDSF